MESDKNPLQVLILERYINKAAYLEVHKSTPEFIEFRKKLTDMSSTMTMDGHSYIETNIGFI